MKINRIAMNSNIYSGKPCIAGARIPVGTILELLEDGLSFDEIVTDYYPAISRDDIRACLEYAKALIDLEDIEFEQTVIPA